MTYSISARCPDTGAFGIAITTSSICVGARCAWVGPAGVVATQNLTDPALGPLGLSLLAQGMGAAGVAAQLAAGTRGPEHRQIAVVDRYGNTGWHTGAKALAVAKDAQGAGAVALGNLLADPGVPAAMVAAFAAAKGETLAERLVRGLEAGKRAGGETGPERSAALLVSTGLVWPVVDLRVDWHDAPIQELRRFWELYRPQQAAYEARAANPGAAPGF
ncbi:MAG: DUF1028 domain-containing protein [Alphaproteobacteria bacterium]|nr:DUF1028 domain-containing protein [Alphaproteobacteria bacterium]